MRDLTNLTDLARQLLSAITPIIASGAVAKLGEDTTDTTQRLAQRAWGLLQHRMQGNRTAEAALTLYEDAPDDPALQQRVQQQIVACFRDAPQASADLADLVRQLQAVQGVPPSVQNRSISVRDQAQVGTAIAGDITGNLTIGPTTFGDQVQGDKASGDITVGHVSGTGIAIGHGSQAQVLQRDTDPHKDGEHSA